MTSLDLLIRGGRVVDGTGRDPYVADVGVAGDRIAEIGGLQDADTDVVIDADGLVVTPGFIDIHSHSDYTLLVDPRAVSAIHQGVTLEVVGNCGYGCCPVRDAELATQVIYGYRPDVPITWRDVAGYLARMDEARPAVNVLTLVPNGQLRLAAVGLEARPATPEEVRDMRYLLEEGLEQGAFGYSTGLEYATEVGASEAEVTELSRAVAAIDGLYATHTRNRDEAAVEAVEEAIRTAAGAGCRLQVSHLTPRGGRGDTERAMAAVDAARARGQDVAFDMHTRLFGTTYLKTVLPPWVLEGGPEAVARRLDDPAARARMKSFRSLITALGDWSRVVLLDNPALPEFSRRNFADIAAELGKDPLDCAYDILLREVDQLYRPMVILHSYTEDLLKLTYEHPFCMVGSDATTMAPDGPLADMTFHGAYTWAAWFYRRLVRETGVFSEAEAIRKITSQPAERLGLADRGVIRPGARADVAVFDPVRFGERGTTFSPNQLAEGMVHVIVNGAITLRDGALTGLRAGTVMRRPG